jgi:hypothetical protein
MNQGNEACLLSFQKACVLLQIHGGELKDMAARHSLDDMKSTLTNRLSDSLPFRVSGIFIGMLGVGILATLIFSRKAGERNWPLKKGELIGSKGPGPGRPWNINLDPHESGMDILT